MKTSIHTLVWNQSVDSMVIESHKKVTNHLGLNVNYYHENSPHGGWINRTLKESSDDVVGFFDIDCVPTNKDIVKYAQEYVYTNKTLIGTAQTSNHMGFVARNHVFAAPAFFFIHREKWFELGCPSFSEADGCDVAQCVTRKAEEAGLRYQCLYPTHWERESSSGAWRLGNYGLYGIGTHYRGGVYHLYESRLNQNIDLFAKRCNEIVSNIFSTADMRSSFDSYSGYTCP
jgi:hypothetical protein